MNRIFAILLLSSVSLGAQSLQNWTQRAGFPGAARHRSVALAVGERGYSGLGHITSVPEQVYDDWWEYDPGSGSWTQRASYPGNGRVYPVAFALDGKAFIGGGEDAAGNYFADCWCFDAANNSWTQCNDLPEPIANVPAASVNGKGYFTGTGGILHEYDPSTGTWLTRASCPLAVTDGATALNGKLWCIGLDSYSITAQYQLWSYDPAADTWIQKATLPVPARQHATLFALAPNLYCGTGKEFVTHRDMHDFWRYRTGSDTWETMDDFSGAARHYSTSFSIGQHAFIGGGTSGINYADFWEFSDLTSVDDYALNILPLSISPNPSAGDCILYFEQTLHNATMSVSTVTGAEVQRIEQIEGEQLHCQFTALPSSVYFITITDHQHYNRQARLILQ